MAVATLNLNRNFDQYIVEHSNDRYFKIYLLFTAMNMSDCDEIFQVFEI